MLDPFSYRGWDPACLQQGNRIGESGVMHTTIMTQ